MSFCCFEIELDLLTGFLGDSWCIATPGFSNGASGLLHAWIVTWFLGLAYGRAIKSITSGMMYMQIVTGLCVTSFAGTAMGCLFD